MTREDKWMKERCGKITASELDRITSASGRIIKGTMSYIRSKRFERKHGYALPVSSRPMEIGNEQEPMIFEWVKANSHKDFADSLVYSKDCPEIPFWAVNWAKFGASPDCFRILPDGSLEVIEFKTLVGNEATEFFADEYTSYVEKKARVVEEHGDQLLGQFLANDGVSKITVVKYIYQNDDILQDTDSPLAPWRGLVFEFKREDYLASLEQMKNRIILIDQMIDTDINPTEFGSGNWGLVDGVLQQL